MTSAAAVVAEVVVVSPASVAVPSGIFDVDVNSGVVASASVTFGVDVICGVVASGSPVERSWAGGCVPGGLVSRSTTKGVTVVAGTGVVVTLGPNIFLSSSVVGLMVVNLKTDGLCVTSSSRPLSSSDGQMKASGQHCSILTPVGLQPGRGGSSQIRSAHTISPNVHLQNVQGLAV